jgi:hypothetical protein
MDQQGSHDRPRDEQERKRREEVVEDLEARDEDSEDVRGGGLKIDGVKGESKDEVHRPEIDVKVPR